MSPLRPVASAVVIALALLAAPARAQSLDDSTRSAARGLGEEGIALFDRGDYAGALARFERAEAVVRMPTLSLRAAWCLEKLGRLVEAAERYLVTTALP